MIQDKNTSVRALLWTTIVISCLLLVNGAFPNGMLAIAGFVLFAIFLYFYAHWAPASFIFGLPLSFLLLTEVFSLAIIENGAYMFEVGDVGSPTGGTSRLVFAYALLFLIVGFFTEKRWKAMLEIESPFDPQKLMNKNLLAFSIIGGMALIYMYFSYYGLTKGFPIFTQQDRYSYRRDFYDPIFILLFSNRLIFTALISMLPTIGYKKIGDALALFLILISALFSEKFTSIVQIIIIYFIPAMVKDLRLKGQVRIDRALIIFTVIGLVTLPIALVVYGAVDDFDGAVIKLGSRIAVQGQMWYVSDRDYFNFFGFNHAAAYEEFASLFSFDDASITQQLVHGRYFVMQHYMDNELLQWVMEIDQGTVFTLLASWLINYGYIVVLILCVLLGIFMGFCLQQMMRAYVLLDFFTMSATHKAYIWLVAGLTNGFAFFIFGIKIVLLLILAAFASYVLRYSRIMRRT